MRKRLITPTPERVRSRGEGWLDVERAAMVEITSEDKDYPVESAFASGEAQGWRAAEAGTQTIRLVFDQPQSLKRISVVFEEKEIGRTQEFVLRWSADGGNSFREIVRQQWTFSTPETIREVEEYQVELASVSVPEWIIVPNGSGGSARASLKSLHLSCLVTSLSRASKRTARPRVLAGQLCLRSRLARSDVFRLEAFGAFGDVELDRLSFLQAAKA